MGAFLDKPKTEKSGTCGQGNGLNYGLSSMQGWRVEMEDAHSAVIGLPGALKNWSFFAIFDGHAGSRVAHFSASALLQSIISNAEFSKNCDINGIPTQDSLIQGIRNGFLSLDATMRDDPDMTSSDDKSGSTAVCVFITPTHAIFINCGDSRAVMSSGQECIFSTLDHKPTNTEERTRIQNAGGSVMIQRVNGSLAVSRALGDFEYKSVAGKGPCEQLVSPEPETTFQPRSSNDEFIVLACDGIWDVMSNEEVCDFIRSRMLLTDDLENICNQVIDTCLHKGSRDNMSIVIIRLENAPKVSDFALQKERELDLRLEAKIKEILQKVEIDDAVSPYLIHLLGVEEIEGLPPGGGLKAKQNTIEEILQRLNPPKVPDDDAIADSAKKEGRENT